MNRPDNSTIATYQITDYLPDGTTGQNARQKLENALAKASITKKPKPADWSRWWVQAVHEPGAVGQRPAGKYTPPVGSLSVALSSKKGGRLVFVASNGTRPILTLLDPFDRVVKAALVV